MSLALQRKSLVAVTILIFFVNSKSSAQEAPNQVKEQIDHKISAFQQALRLKPVNGETWKELKPDITTVLTRAHNSLVAGRLYAALDDLARAWVPMVSAEYADAHPSVPKDGMRAFDAEWRRLDGELKQEEDQFRAADWDQAPAAVRAIAESHQGQVRPLYQAGRAFAMATEPKDGVYYLGEAKANGEVALFCQSLHFDSLHQPLAVRSYLPELDRLQEKVRAAYQPPLSIDRHSEFIRLNSTLKLAQELDAAKFYYGALYQYLDALRLYSALDPAAASPPNQAAMRVLIAQQRKPSSKEPADSSIREFLLQQAEASLAGAGAAKPEERARAQAIVTQVIPAYFGTLEKVSVPTETTSHLLTLTLLRWPYT